MGEIADDVIANIAEFGDDFDRDEEWPFKPWNAKMLTCRHCGEEGLYWRKVDDKWRLCEKDSDNRYLVHECNDYFVDKSDLGSK